MSQCVSHLPFGMVAPVFGLSASDLLAAANLLNNVRKALKTAGGAAQDYRATVERLDNLVDILKLLQSVFNASPELDPDRRIWRLASSCERHLQEFCDKQQKFWQPLCGVSVTRWTFKGGFRKIQWALTAVNDVDVLWKAVHQELATLDLAVGLQSLIRNSEVHEQQTRLLQCISAQVQQSRVDDGKIFSIMQLQRRMLSLSDKMGQMQTSLVRPHQPQTMQPLIAYHPSRSMITHESHNVKDQLQLVLQR